MKKQKKIKLIGFKKYAAFEKIIIECCADDFMQQHNPIFKSKSETITFAESIGTCQLFSVLAAAKFHTNAKLIFGNENAKYVQNKIEDALRLGNRRALAKAPKVETISQLRESFPNFCEAIDVIEGAFALSHLSAQGYLQISPILLLGPPGVGKTAFVQSLSKLIGINFSRIDIGTSSSSAILAGLSLTWSSGRCGEIFNLLTESEFMNPIVILDEVDKAVGNHSAPIEPILLSLLEPESSSTFKDEAIQMQINASNIIWIATANKTERISEPLMSRFTVVEIKQPSYEQSKKIVRNIYKSFKTDNKWGASFEDDLDAEVINKLSKNTPRVATKLLQQAFGKAAINHRNKILTDDISCLEIKQSYKIGFV